MRLWNNLKTAFLLGGLMGLCMFFGHVMGGPQGLVIGFLLGGAANLVAYFFSDKLALAAMGARPLERHELPWLYDAVERMATRAGLPMPRLYVCPQAAPNAFATGRSPQHSAIAVTQGMLQYFPRHEIEGVLAHELAHIKHRDVLISTIAAVMAGVITHVAYMLMWFGGGVTSHAHDEEGESHNPLAAVGSLAMLLLAPLAAMLIQLAISRQREYAADSYGGELCGDPRKLAAALARLGNLNERIPSGTNPALHNLYIVEPLSGGGIVSWLATHPPLEKRIALLERQAQRAETAWAA